MTAPRIASITTGSTPSGRRGAATGSWPAVRPCGCAPSAAGPAGNGVSIPHGALPGDHVHMSVSVPPEPAVPDPVRRTEGRSSHRVQRGFPGIRRRCRGRRLWGRGHFPATTGAITDGPVLQYPDRHLPDATGASR